MYWDSVAPDELDIYAKIAFNCLMPYRPPSEKMMTKSMAAGLERSSTASRIRILAMADATRDQRTMNSRM